jgi:methyl-accepting chemotaxis protein
MQAKKSELQKKGMLRTLKFKMVMVSTVLILIAVLSLTFTFIQRQRGQIRTQLISRGETITALLAYNARYGVQISDKPILDKIIGGVKEDADVVYCLIADKQGTIIASYNQDRSDVDKIKKNLTTGAKSETQYLNKQKEEVINISAPVVLASSDESAGQKQSSSSIEEDLFSDEESSGSMNPQAAAPSTNTKTDQNSQRVIGSVQVGITLNNMKKEISSSIMKTLLYSAVIFIVGFILAYWFGTIIAAPIRKVVELLTDISQGEGDLSQRVHLKSSDEIGDLAAGFNTFMDKFQEVKKISIFLNELADGGGDLTKRLNIQSADEIGMLAKGFDRFTDKLHEIICQVAENTEKIAQASQAVSDTTVKLARDLDEVAVQSGEVAESSGQISRAIELTSNNVSNVNDLMNKTERNSSSGVDVVHEARTGMDQIAETIKASSDVVAKLNESSQKIGETISTITEIADQTKLIAINAAIEASRVGAQGKGFAVVAEEIRRLATRVTKATQDISQRIRAIQEESYQVVSSMKKGMEEATHGLDLSNKSEEALKSISISVVDAKGRVNQIAVASNEQTASIGIISKNITGISEASKQCSQGVSRTAQSMQELNKKVQALRQLVGQFVLAR